MRVSDWSSDFVSSVLAQGFVNAVQVYPFVEGTIYQCYTAPGFVTDIALQPGEDIVAVASGDTARWVIGDTTSGTGESERSHILVKPFAAGLSPNLVITSDRRSYHVRLVSTARTAMAAMRRSEEPTSELQSLLRTSYAV